MTSTTTKSQNNRDYDYVEEGCSFAQIWIAETEQRKIDDLLVTLSDVNTELLLWTRSRGTRWNYLLPMPRPTCDKERLFLNGFIEEFWEQQCVRREALRHRCYTTGLAIGKRWAAEIATDQELSNLAESLPYLIEEYTTCLPDDDPSGWPISHDLLHSILGGELENPELENSPLSDVYFQFWNRLLPMPIDKSNFAEVVTPSHPLQSGSFAIGFADGAFGISDQLT